jgi:hypothetical protein
VCAAVCACPTPCYGAVRVAAKLRTLCATLRWQAGQTPLHWACKVGCLSVMTYLASLPEVNVGFADAVSAKGALPCVLRTRDGVRSLARVCDSALVWCTRCASFAFCTTRFFLLLHPPAVDPGFLCPCGCAFKSLWRYSHPPPPRNHMWPARAWVLCAVFAALLATDPEEQFGLCPPCVAVRVVDCFCSATVQRGNTTLHLAVMGCNPKLVRFLVYSERRAMKVRADIQKRNIVRGGGDACRCPHPQSPTPTDGTDGRCM